MVQFGFEFFGVEQGVDDVVGEIVEVECGVMEVFELVVDCFGGVVVGVGVVEVGQYVQGLLFQGLIESDQFGELCGYFLGEVVDYGLQSFFFICVVGVVVGGDDVLVDVLGCFDFDVFVLGEYGFQVGDLFVGEQVSVGVQYVLDFVEWIFRLVLMVEGGLLDVLVVLIDFFVGQGDDVEGVYYCGCFGQFFGGCGFEVGEFVYCDGFDFVLELGGLVIELGFEYFF